MLLTIDIGNSNITCGIFKNSSLIKEWRIQTEKEQDEDWYKQQIIQETEDVTITAIVIGSVVPELDTIFSSLSQKLFQITPLFVSTSLKTNIANLSEKPTPLGADRIADIAAAIHLTSGNRIVIDMGTATKFEVISQTDEYLGGAISPGVQVSFDALINRASKLSTITLEAPKKVVGDFTTEEHLRSGFIHGFASLVDGMIGRIKQEEKWEKPHIFLTGGFTDVIAPHLTEMVTIHKTLTIEGLRILWELQKK